jgi:hypothetical protein
VTNLMADWMGPLNRLVWFRAFKTRAKTVRLADGRTFTLNYTEKPGKVVIRPKKGFVPCGTFELDRVTHLDWLSESENPKRVQML